MSDLPPARGPNKIIDNMTEVAIFDVEESVRFLMYESWLLNIFWMRKHPIPGRFWGFKENFEICT